MRNGIDDKDIDEKESLKSWVGKIRNRMNPNCIY